MPPLRQIAYVGQRALRNLLPEPLARLGRRLAGGIAGGESDAPEYWARHYVASIAATGRTVEGAEVLVFGHGPSYGFAAAIAAAGARHVYLYDPYAAPDERLNRRWLGRYPGQLVVEGGRVRPRRELMTVVAERGAGADAELPAVDVVLSTSVFEHLRDVGGWAGRLARATRPDGLNLHMIDLRDHFFATPFEMLCYPERVWERWLDPRQHLNRLRLPAYRAAFERYFAAVEVETMNRDDDLFAAARPRIRPEFLTGDAAVDAVLEIQVRAERPRGG